MTHIVIATTIAAPPAVVWADVRDIQSHTGWMADAESIHFTSAASEGVGTTFDCKTKIGPIRLTDRMEVTEWVEGSRMGIRHVGLVTGTGRFTLARTDLGGTRFVWEEDLSFPWWMGGSFGGLVGAQVLRLVWRRNLQRLKDRIEGASTAKA